MITDSDFLITDEVDNLLEFGQQIANSLSSALIYMRKKFKLVPSSEGEMTKGGWSQYIEEQIKPPSITGTACILSSIIRCGENKKSEIVSFSKNFIIKGANEDGGWSKPSLQKYYSLTLTTCQAIRALLDAEQPSTSSPIQKAIEWLLKAQNVDGGWGFLAKDKQSDVTATAYAMQALARVVSVYQEAEEAIVRGQKWLIEIRNPDNSWGRRKVEHGTLSHTSHALEALLASGISHSVCLPTCNWLIANYQNNRQFLDHYIVIFPNGDTERLTWTHISCERALIALLKLNVSLSSVEVVECVNKILERQVNGTYWSVEVTPTPAASWAISEAVISLRLYIDRLEHQGYAVALSSSISKLRKEIKELRERIIELESRIPKASFKARIRKLLRFLKKPVPLLIIVTIILIGVYLFLRGSSATPLYAEIIVGIFGIIGLSLTTYQVVDLVRERRKRHE